MGHSKTHIVCATMFYYNPVLLQPTPVVATDPVWHPAPVQVMALPV